MYLTQNSLAGRNSGQATAEGAAAVARLEPVPVRRRTGLGIEVPGAAPDHPVRAPFIEVLAPLPDVAVQIVYTKPVRFVRAHLGRAAESVAEVGELRCEIVGRLIEVEVEGALVL